MMAVGDRQMGHGTLSGNRRTPVARYSRSG
jgi:hypothetical protein